MDKIFSTRIDEAIVKRINLLSRKSGRSKKSIIEHAVSLYADKIEHENNFDVFEQTLGVWERNESPDKTVKNARNEFRKSLIVSAYFDLICTSIVKL